MNLKKILACAVSTMMLFSGVVANAELSVTPDDDMGYRVETLPTSEEILARNPILEITSTLLTDQADVRSYSNVAWSGQHNINNFDVYKVDLNFTNLGPVFNGYNADWTTKSVTGVSGVQFTFIDGASQIAGNDITPVNLLENGNGTFTVNGNNLVLNWAASDTANPHPDLGEEVSIYEENGDMSLSVLVALSKGGSLTFNSFTSQITYTVSDGIQDTNTQNQNTQLPETVTIGTPAPEPAALDMTVDFSGKYDNGYVWQANITKGENDIDSFTAKFTADTETADRAIINVEDMVGKFTGEGTLSFNIGLDTTKTLTGAEFTVGAGAESKTVAAPLE